MNETIASNWIAALRSGEYAQGKDCLCVEIKKVLHFDALGVLCELACKESELPTGGKITRSRAAGSGVKYVYDGAAGMLPPRVAAWADMGSGWENIGGRAGGTRSLRGRYGKRDLIQDNDEGKTFVEIADIIEKHWEVM